MICLYCKESVEIGEAKEEVEIANRIRYFHPGHWKLYQQQTLAHYERQAQLARTVH